MEGSGPHRMCVGCRTRLPQGELIRIQISGDSEWLLNGKGTGRSAYWCGSERCLKVVLAKGRLGHALKRPIDESTLAALRLTLPLAKR